MSFLRTRRSSRNTECPPSSLLPWSGVSSHSHGCLRGFNFEVGGERRKSRLSKPHITVLDKILISDQCVFAECNRIWPEG